MDAKRTISNEEMGCTNSHRYIYLGALPDKVSEVQHHEGQPTAYLVAQIIAIKSGSRVAAGMGAYNVAQVTERDIREIAEYFS